MKISEYRASLAAENGGADPYADLTDQQFAARLHQRHYADIPFEDFAGRVGLQGNYAPAGPQTRPRTNPANNAIDGRPLPATEIGQPSRTMTATRTRLPGGTVIGEPADPNADLRALERLPANTAVTAGALYKRAAAGAERGFSDINARMAASASQSYQRAGRPETPDFSDQFNTQLTPWEESLYQDWRAEQSRVQGRDLAKDEADYDLRGAWRAGAGKTAGGHLPDTFKKPNHPTFSKESQYSGVSGIEGGEWQQVNGKWRFVASRDQFKYRSPEQLRAYFDKVEKDSELVVPDDEQRQAAQRGAAIEEAEGRAFQAELSAGRMGRVERRAAAEAAAAMPADAGPIERALQSGVASTLATAPIVTAGALIPGAQAPALVALGGMTGAQRYGELRAAGFSEGEAALSGAYLGGLEALTEKFPLGTLAKNSPFLQRAAEFMVTDLLGENVNTAAQIADDYRLGLTENVTVADIQQALKDTTAATVVGAGAQLSLAELTRQVLERANDVAAAREPEIEVPELTDIVEPPLLTDEAAFVEEGAPAEEIELGGDGEMLPGEIRVEEMQPEEIDIEADPVRDWEREQDTEVEDPELGDITFEETSEGPPPIEPVLGAPGTEPEKPTMAQRRQLTADKHEAIRAAFGQETKPNGVTYTTSMTTQGNELHGVAVDGQVRAWFGSEATAREALRDARADLLKRRIDAAANEAASSPTNDRTESFAQIEANNRKLGHVSVQGLDISIENPKGSIRRSKPDAAMKWERKMRDHYGYIRGTEDNTGEHVDAFVGPHADSDTVYVIDQVIDGKFDEPKVMVGYRTEKEARAAYLRNYQDGWDGLGAIAPMAMDEFRKWVRSGGPKKPLNWKPDPAQRVAQNADQLKYMAERAGWQEIGGQAITEGDAVKAQVTGRTKWLPREPWFAEVQREAPLPGNTQGKATAVAVSKAIAGQKLTAAEQRHVNAMNDAIERQQEEDKRLATTLEQEPEELTDAEINALEARLERLSKRLESYTKEQDEKPLPTGPGVRSDVPLFQRSAPSRAELGRVADEISERHGLQSLELYPRSNGDVEIGHIETPKGKRGTGIGTRAMQDILAYADGIGARLILTPASRDDGFGTTSRARLVKFYKRFGFVQNRGRNKDFTIMDGMYRNPQRGKEETLYRGEYSGNKGGGFYTPDKEFARQFTQSGQDKEIKQIKLSSADIFEPAKDVYAGDPDAVDVAVEQARKAGKRAVRLSEGAGQPKSVLLIDRWKSPSAPGDDDVMFERTRGQGDLFGDLNDVKNALKKLEAEKDRRRNSGQESTETGRPGDLFSQATRQVDVEDVAAPKQKTPQIKRGRPRTFVTFKTPYVGKTGAKLVGYEWKWTLEEYVDKRGEDRVGRRSDWAEAVSNPETDRDIVHQFHIEQNGETRVVSADTAARLLGLSETSIRQRAKSMLAKEQAALEREEKVAVSVQELLRTADWHDTPAQALAASMEKYPLRRKAVAWGKDPNPTFAGDSTEHLTQGPDGRYTDRTLPTSYMQTNAWRDAGLKNVAIKARDIWDREGKPVQSTPMRRRGGPKPGSLNERDVRAEVNRILREFKTRPRLMVVQRYDQLPRALRTAMEDRGTRPGDAKALQWNGGIYFIADHFTDMASVVDSVLHETVIHYGLRAVIDLDTHRAILDGVARDQGPAVRRQGIVEFGDQFDWDSLWMRRVAAEEVLAYYAEDYLRGKPVPSPLKQWLKKLLDAIRAFVDRVLNLRRTDTLELPENFGKYQVERIIDALHTYLKEGRTPDYVDGGDAFAERRTVEVERVRYPITDASGQLVAQEPREQMNFWRWFRGSKVVDGHGRPLRLYHGTPIEWDTNTFRRGVGHNKRSSLGHHFGTTQAANERLEDAMYRVKTFSLVNSELHPALMPVYLQAKNLLRLRDIGAWHDPKWINKALSEVGISDQGNTIARITKGLKALGYDGIVYKNDFEAKGSDSYVVFDSSQIKSAIGNSGTFDPANPDIMYQRTAPTFYSALTRAVENAKTVRAPAAQWMATIRNAPGVKAEEIAWSGVEEWLSSLGRPATREQLAEFLRANEIQVQDVVKGGESENKVLQEHDRIVVELTALGYTPNAHMEARDLALMDREGNHWLLDDGLEWKQIVGEGLGLPNEIRQLGERLQYLRYDIDNAGTSLGSEFEDEETRYSQYTTPGGENYRELLLTLPINTKTHQVFNMKTGMVVASFDTSEEAAADAESRGPGFDSDTKYSHRNPDVYRSSHWDEHNILAHVRFNERTDADGKRVLFIEEIQSDWHQEGRKRGYRGPVAPPSQEHRQRAFDELLSLGVEPARVSGLMNGIMSMMKGGNDGWRAEFGIPEGAAMEVESYAEQLLRYEDSQRTVPDAPFKTTWPELAFKRMLRWAAENDFERIGWLPGKAQAERYSLRKQISTLSLTKIFSDQPEFFPGLLDAYDLNGNLARSLRMESREQLIETVGEEVAQQLLAAKPDLTGRGNHRLRLDVSNMEVGGEGMIGFYDQILPAAVNKMVKRWGTRVGTTTVDVSGGKPTQYQDFADYMAKKDVAPTKVHAVDVTPAMRDAALEGLPLFSRAGARSEVMLRDLPKDSTEARGYAGLANRIIDVWNRKIGHKYGALGNLPEAKKYLIERYKTLGGLTQVREISREIFTSLSSATPADAERVYSYLTTPGASPDSIESAPVRSAAISAKQTIDEQGQALVQAGLLSEESYEVYRDQYLPRLYLRHILDDKSRGRMAGSGKKLSDQGYLKQRKDIPEEVRKVILGEITDPAFLAAFGVSRTMRDLTIMNFLQTISQNRAWTPEVMLVEWDGRRVSPYWLQSEAKQLRRQADHIKNVLIAGKARAIADRMDTAANKAVEALGGVDLTDFKQIPDSKRYGALRGLWVRKEIHEDLVGAYQFIESDSLLDNIFGQGGMLTKATQAWKTSKVAMNVPSHFRNMMGNAMMLHLSGVPMARVPDRILSAVNSVINKDNWYQIALKYGMREATFANTELFRIRDEWLLLQKSKQPTANKLHAMFGKVTDAIGDVYQFEEALFKIAKLRDAMEREELSEADAMIESHKWIFDYSLVPRWVRYLRNAPFGIPFLSYSYFAMPRLAEVAVRRPWKFLPYIAVVAAIQQSIMSMYGADDDDLDKLRAAFPEWMRSRGGMLLMPWKDSGGRWQVVDLGYTVPWGQMVDVMAQVREGNYRQSAETMGLFSGPLPDIIAAWQTNRDPFTGREIANGGDPKWRQALSILNYAWGMAAPGFITSTGALGKVRDAYTGKVDPRTGEPTLTKTQAWLRLFGVSVYPVDPEVTRQRNLRSMSFEIDETRRRLGEQMRDRNLTEEQKNEIREVYRKEILLRQEKLRKYQEESEIPENLRRTDRDLTGRLAPMLDGKSKAEAVQALKDAGYPQLAALFSELPARPRPAVLQALAEARA